MLSRLGVLSRVMVKGIEVYAQSASDFFSEVSVPLKNVCVICFSCCNL